MNIAHFGHYYNRIPGRETIREERFIWVHNLKGTIHRGQEDMVATVAPSVVRGVCKMTC